MKQSVIQFEFLKIKINYQLMAFFWVTAIAISGCNKSSSFAPPAVGLGSSLNTRTTEQQPNFSHDGNFLVFTSDRQKSRNIFLYDVRQSRFLSLPGLNQTQSMQYQPDISADGRYLVYVSEQYGKTSILLYDRVRKKSQNISQNLQGEVRNPTISGNGRVVAFEINRGGQWDIQIHLRN